MAGHDPCSCPTEGLHSEASIRHQITEGRITPTGTEGLPPGAPASAMVNTVREPIYHTQNICTKGEDINT